MGFKKGSLTWVLAVGVCMNVAYTDAWGSSYVCDLKEQGLQKIGEICSWSSASMGSPLSVLEEKLDRVLDFMEEIKTTEDSWLYTTKKSGTVERDLSKHEESGREEKEDDGIKETDQDTVDTRDRDQSRQETSDDSHRRGDGYTRIEDDHWQSRRDRSSKYDWRDRRDYTSRDEGQDTRQRTDEGDREDVRDRTSGDDTRRQSSEIDVRREKKKEEKEDDTGPKKGECSAIVMDNHETIGMFYMMSYQHGHCANRNPISQPIRYCLGYCTTKTFIERESGIWSQGNDCKSCQPLRFETLRIPLSCDDGFTFEKKFQNVVDCSCRRCNAVENSRKP